MNVDVVFLPRDLQPSHLSQKTVVVFDVLRATTSMTAALAAGVEKIFVFPDTASALSAAGAFSGRRLLVGEEKCLTPPGFDLGNSPGAFRSELHAGQTTFMSTTNGTRALLSARGAETVLVGALTNASAVAGAVRTNGVTLLCAGTEGSVAMEDVTGAGAVLAALERRHELELDSDTALLARRLFQSVKEDLPGVLRTTRGGRNVVSAGLEKDIDFAARLDVTDVVGFVAGNPPVVLRLR